MMEASCENCQHLKDGTCGLGVTLPEGEKLCDRYEITPEFKEQLVSAFMKENPMQIPVPLIAKAQRAKAAAEGAGRKGFRQRKQRK